MTSAPRGPKTFDPRDPDLRQDEQPSQEPPGATPQPGDPSPQPSIPTLSDLRTGLRWGALFFSAALALTTLSIGLWFSRLISVALERDDWVGWLSLGLFTAMGLAALAIAVRELLGLMRLRKLSDLRRRADLAYANDDLKAARKVVSAVRSTLANRDDLAWHRAKLAESSASVMDGAALLALTDRHLMKPIDDQCKDIITRTAKRVAITTALSPSAALDVLAVIAFNLGMIRRIATRYGGRPGFLGGLKLTRMVISHIVVTGGLALTEDLFGQFIGQDLIRRLSRKAGEGLFNGALTARLGIAAMEVSRPIGFIEAERPRFRSFLRPIAASFVTAPERADAKG